MTDVHEIYDLISNNFKRKNKREGNLFQKNLRIEKYYN